MKSSWDKYLDHQLRKPRVKESFEQESKALKIGVALATQRRKRGLTQAQVAKRIGTSTPQISRTERKPEHTNVQTLMRYAAAVGMELDVKLVAKR